MTTESGRGKTFSAGWRVCRNGSIALLLIANTILIKDDVLGSGRPEPSAPASNSLGRTALIAGCKEKDRVQLRYLLIHLSRHRIRLGGVYGGRGALEAHVSEEDFERASKLSQEWVAKDPERSVVTVATEK